MFEAPAPKTRITTGKLLSLAAHALFIYLLVAPPQALIVLPMQTMRGDHGSSRESIFMPVIASDTGTARRIPKDVNKNVFTRAPRLVEPAHKPKTLALDTTTTPPKKQQEAHMGSELGLFAWGMEHGHDVRPALPVVAPDPKIGDPSRLAGDVIVEVTIDSTGVVIGTRLITGINSSVDDTIIATLETWHFTPATLDGAPIPSQHDVHFHFPA